MNERKMQELRRWELRTVPDVPEGLCHVCHYDLTANTSGVCPECGAPILNAEQRLAYRIAIVRKHRGDRVGLVLFTVIALLGIPLCIFGTGELGIIGIAMVFIGCGMIPFMIQHMLWLRTEERAARKPRSQRSK